MPRFFLPEEAFCTDTVVINGEDASHISRSLRMKTGDALTLCDMNNTDYFCVIESIDSDSVTVRVREKGRSKSEMPCRTVLYQAVAKGEKMDVIVQKAVELGVCEIVPVESERCVAKIPPDAEEKKIRRWQKIAKEASGQCGRGVIPRVMPKMSYAEAVKRMKQSPLALLCYEGENTVPLGTLFDLDENAPAEISFFIGPEGGISPDEVRLALENGIRACGLGPRILRTETASSYMLSAISFRFERD